MTRTSAKQREPHVIKAHRIPRHCPVGMVRVTVTTQGDGYTSVDAWVFGEWAAHRRIGGGDVWDVTYLPCGMNITSGSKRASTKDRQLDEFRAKRLADWLGCHISREEMFDWSSPSEEVAARIHQGLEAFSTGIGGIL